MDLTQFCGENVVSRYDMSTPWCVDGVTYYTDGDVIVTESGDHRKDGGLRPVNLDPVMDFHGSEVASILDIGNPSKVATITEACPRCKHVHQIPDPEPHLYKIGEECTVNPVSVAVQGFRPACRHFQQKDANGR